MTQAKSKISTFADYLAYDDGTDSRYELTYGELVEVPSESDENVLISRALDRVFSEIVGFRRVRTYQLAIELPGQPKNRYPDVTVLRTEHLEQLRVPGEISHHVGYGSSPCWWLKSLVLGQTTVVATILISAINTNGVAFLNTGSSIPKTVV